MCFFHDNQASVIQEICFRAQSHRAKIVCKNHRLDFTCYSTSQDREADICIYKYTTLLEWICAENSKNEIQVQTLMSALM